VAALAGAFLLPVAARAWVVVGLPPVVIGPPVVPYAPYYPPPAYYYPPGYYPPYAPPPAPAPQAQQSTPAEGQSKMSEANTPYGSTCYAGFYTCPAPYAAHVGTTCACAGIGAPSYGTVR
jgi:hypothetical protein